MPFTPQLTVPADTDPFFIRKQYGGYSPCIQGRPEKFPGSPLANCVGYAWGIAAERDNAEYSGLIPGSGRSPGEGNGSPLQYSCLGSPMDRGAWRA